MSGNMTLPVFAGKHRHTGKTFLVFEDGPDISPMSNEPRNYEPDGTPVKAGWYWAEVDEKDHYLTHPKGPFPEAEGAYLSAIGE